MVRLNVDLCITLTRFFAMRHYSRMTPTSALKSRVR
jgi:hypothetical protein